MSSDEATTTVTAPAEEVSAPAPDTAPPAASVLGTERSDIEEIDPQPLDAPVRIDVGAGDGGVLVQVNRLKTREFLALLRFLARGLGPAVTELDFGIDDPNTTDQDIIGSMTGTLIVALGEASDEFLMFVQAVVAPVGKDDRGRVAQAMANPEIDDFLVIAERVILQELPDLRRLLGNAQAMWSKIQKAYQKHPIAG